MRSHLTLLSVVLLTGCVTPTISEYQAPDGTKLKKVKCTSDSQKCLVTASQSCPDGGTYRVISSESHAGGLVADLIPGPATWYGMTYACGISDGQMPDFKFHGQRYTPPPIIVNQSNQRSTTTRCNRLGDTVTCNTD